jgi:hypothetical protein
MDCIDYSEKVTDSSGNLVRYFVSFQIEISGIKHGFGTSVYPSELGVPTDLNEVKSVAISKASSVKTNIAAPPTIPETVPGSVAVSFSDILGPVTIP